MIFEFIKKRFKRIKRKFSVKKISLKVNSDLECLGLPEVIEVDGFYFEKIYKNFRGDALWGVDRKQLAFIKIGLFKHPRKSHDILGESKIINFLNQKGAISCPKLFSSGVQSFALQRREIKNSDPLPYFITEYIAPGESCTFADIIFSMLEQKSLGVYQGDVKPANIIFSEKKGIAYYVDYDQAELLEEEVKNLSNSEFYEWTENFEKKKYFETSWLRHFSSQITKSDYTKLFRDQSLNLAQTSLYLRQKTTNTDNGVYHTLSTKFVYADGVRDLQEREKILNNIDFSKGETILDIGCNVGLLTMYFKQKRACKAFGFELDESIVTAAKMIANILNLDIKYTTVDLDTHSFKQEFNTICLFSVFHHTKEMVNNGKKIAAVCQRVIIECRLTEKGKMPEEDDNKWIKTSSWDYKSLNDLYVGLEEYFKGMKFYKNYGAVDKSRYIIELRK